MAARTPGHLLKLHPNQRVVSQDRRRFRVVVADRRWGKTHLSRVELTKAAFRKKKSLVWYVAPSYGMAKDIMWDELCEIIPNRLIKKKNETKMTIRLINGSVIQLKGADEPDSLRGRGVDFVVLDEFQDFKEGVWEEVVYPTLTDRQGKALIIGTPKAFNQLYGVWARGQSGEEHDSDWASWQFPTSTSPFIPKKEIEAARRNLHEKAFKQEYEASFETMSGRVYYAFDRKDHVGTYNLDPHKPILIGMDFNVDPMSAVVMQWHKEKNQLWIVDEINMKQSNVSEIADEIEKRYWRQIKNKRVAVYPDPAGNNRNQGRGESNFDVLRSKGINKIIYRPKHPMVADRVNSVNSMLRAADGSIRLVVDKSCKETIKSLEQTLYKSGTATVDKSAGMEHMADALGYPIEFIFPAKRLSLMGASY
jgi:hypothetical protein